MQHLVRWGVIHVVRLLARITAQVDVTGLQNVPATGPAILVTNHTNSIEPLLLYSIVPRHITALSKVELWDSPILAPLMTGMGAIPVRRSEMDIDAIRQALQVLHDGGMMGLAPEGTRTRTGRLIAGRPGSALLALHAPEAVIVPTAVYGHAYFSQNLRRLRRTRIHVVFGQGFYTDSHGQALTHNLRQKVSDELMWQIAALLPPENRGVYSNLDQASEHYLRFPPGTSSVLSAARAKGTSLTTGSGAP